MAVIPLFLGLVTGCGSAEDTPAKESAPVNSGSEILSEFMCSADANGVWRGKATLNNVGSATNTYTVRFSVVSNSDSMVVGYKEDDFTVEPGGSVDVAFPNIATDRANGLKCVSRVSAQPGQ